MPPTPQKRPQEGLLWVRHAPPPSRRQTCWGRGPWRAGRSRSPLPLHSRHCVHTTLTGCVCGVGGRGWLTRVCRPEHHQLRKRRPHCDSRGGKGPSGPAARGQRPGPGMGSSPQRLPGKEGSWSSGSSSHGRLYSRTGVLAARPLTDAFKLFPFVLLPKQRLTLGQRTVLPERSSQIRRPASRGAAGTTGRPQRSQKAWCEAQAPHLEAPGVRQSVGGRGRPDPADLFVR